MHVGKTALMERFVNDNFRVRYLKTIGIDFFIRNVTLDKMRLKLHLWDISGNERFQHLLTRHVFGLGGLFYAYDVSDQQIFECLLTNWIPCLEINGTRVQC